MLKKIIIVCTFAILPFISAYAEERLALGFFADQQAFNINERKQLVAFLDGHKSGDFYEFELLSLSDPLMLNLDDKRLKNIEALFRQYGINIDGLLSAKLRFIASYKQQLVVIRKTK